MTLASHRGFLACAFALATPGLGAASPVQSPAESAVDAIFQRYDSKSTPGCNVAVVEGERVLLRKSYGMADIALGVPMRSSTSHWIPYSEARVFLGLAVATLAREGRFTLDDPIRRHVPQVPGYAQAVTIRHLLHHTSGLADYGVLAGPGFELQDRMSEDEFFRMLARWNKLGFAPGADSMYSNTDYALLRILVERATGGTLDAYLRKTLFEPLGMASTRVGTNQAGLVPGHALFHEDSSEGFRRVLGYRLSPVGGIAISTSLDDVLRWDRALRDPARGYGKLLAELEAGAPAPAAGAEGQAFSFGLHRRSLEGVPVVEYRGLSGYAWLMQAPGKDISVATLCNHYYGMDAFATRVMALYVGKAPAEGAAPAGATPAAPAPVAAAPRQPSVPVEVPPAELQRYVGNYRDAGGRSRVVVQLTDGRLVVTPRGRPSLAGVVPLGRGRFATAAPYDLVFAPGNDGEIRLETVDRVNGEPGGEDLRRTVVTWPSAERARELAGTYEGDDLEIVLHVRADGEVVRMAARGMAEAAIIPETVPDTFLLPDVYTARFERDAAGKVVAVVLDANRVKGMRFTRR